MDYKKIGLLAVFFILFSSFAFAENITGFECLSNVLTETFTFSGLYSANNWTYSTTSTYFNSSPLNYSAYYNNSFGLKATDRGLASTTSNYIRKTLTSQGIKTGNLLLIFNFSMLTLDSAPNSDINVILSKAGSPFIGIYLCDGYETGHTYCNLTLSGTDTETCTLSLNYTPPFNSTAILELDLNNDLYSFYLYNESNQSGVDYGCIDKALPADFNITRLQIGQTWYQDDAAVHYLDDLKVCYGSTLTGGLPSSCYDSDDDDIFNFGYVTLNSITTDDYCEDDTILVEGECIDGAYYPYYVDCSDYNGSSCYGGKCQKTEPMACSYPALFCDDFNYIYDVSLRGWTAQNSIGNSISLAPDGNVLNMSTDAEQVILHRLDSFDILYYASGYWYSIIDLKYTPVMSAQFEFNPMMQPNSSCMYYKGTAVTGAEVFDFAFCLNNSDVYLKNYTGDENVQGDNWQLICDNCINNKTMNSFKVSAYFKNRAYYTEFNSSNLNDSLKVYFNDVYLGQYNMTLGQELETDSLKIFELTKTDNASIALEDYYVYLGDDKDYDTTQDYFASTILVIYEPETNATIGTGQSSDFATSIASLWYTFGLRSTASRVLFGLLMLFLILIGYVLICMAWRYQPSPVIAMIIEFFSVLIFVYTGLIPVWILFLIVIIAIIVAILMVMLRRS